MPDPKGQPPPPDPRSEAMPTVIAPLSADPNPASSPPQPAPQGSPFGRYTLLDELGRGGMGVVWKAWDSQLFRVVALKLIRPDSAWGEEGVERFAREARLAARLRHPNIVPVHDVGVQDGQHYFTSDFIAGQTLDDVLSSPVPVRQSITWVRQIADALGYAHANGVVHRDVKPGNILVDERGQPYIMDFGLAREVAAGSGMTLSGQFMGTPEYMSPEQAMGRTYAAGPASDQFSLAVILYEILTGRAPFEGPDLRELLNAIAETDPVRPSRLSARIHADVETICLKALEKDPSRRYATMAEFASDLGRYLDGEPILARPLPRAALLLRKAWKHRAIVLPSAVALALVFAWAGWSVVSSRRFDEVRAGEARARAEAARAQEALAKAPFVLSVLRRFADLSGTLRTIEALRYDARLDPAERRRRAAEHWGPVQAFIDGTPSDPASQATMKALAGWAIVLAGDPKSGEEWMCEASSIDPQVPFGPVLRAMVLLASYVGEQRLPAIRGSLTTGVTFGEAPRETPQQAALRDRLRPLLEAAAAATLWGKQEADAFRAALEGMRALHDGDLARADEQLGKAIDADEVRPFSTALHVARTQVRYLRKDFAGAREDLDAVEDVMAGTTDYWIRAGMVSQGEGDERAAIHEDPIPSYQRAVQEHREAAKLEPGSSGHRTNLANALASLAEARAARGEEPWEEFRRALSEHDLAVECSPSDPGPLAARARTRASLAVAEDARGGDPLEGLSRAVADATEALRLDPGSVGALRARAFAHAAAGRAQAERGIDPREELTLAIADHDGVLRLEPGNGVTIADRASARLTLARWDISRGADPRDGLGAVIEDLGPAEAKGAPTAWTRRIRALVRQDQGDWEARNGDDPRESYRAAIAELDEAVRLDPKYAPAFADRGNARRALGEADAARGGDPREAFRAAIADCDAALGLDPGHVEALNHRGTAQVRLAESEGARGEDPREGLRRGIDDYDRFLQRTPGHVAVLSNRGVAWRRLAEADAARGQDATDAFGRSVADCTAALELNPSSVLALIARGNARLAASRVDAERGLDPRPACELAVADFDEALRQAPNDPNAFMNRGSAHYQIAQASLMRGQDPRGECRAAIADYTEILGRQKEDATAFFNRSNAWRLLGDGERACSQDPRESYRKSIADIDEALRIRPHDPTVLTGRAASCTRMGQALAEQGQDPRESYQEAVKSLDEAVQRDPTIFGIWSNRSVTLRYMAEAEAARGVDPRATFERAVADATEALRRNPAEVNARLARALALLGLGRTEAAGGADGGDRYRAAIEDCDAAVARNPSMWSAFVAKGRVCDAMGRPRDAVEAYRAALRVGPSYPELQTLLAAAERAAELEPGEGK